LGPAVEPEHDDRGGQATARIDVIAIFPLTFEIATVNSSREPK
jgi:hypothetical protein